MKVDFEIDSSGAATGIYKTKDVQAENTSVMRGVAALALTFFLGFIGTFLSRLLLAKQGAGEAALPAAGHFAMLFLMFIPILGWIAYFAGTIYFMVTNYRLAVSSK